ncbi:hypothetical protein ACJMK2_035137 [Sinanodonta woodiana]|uniref:Uncharacterized protein n=1 Tax=Sinanodonta woodiana TaxID=1069815 RepID=A0ABD3WTY0_SINWO
MFRDITSQSPILAEFYYTTFVFLVIFCLLTMATTILNETIEHVTREPRRSNQNALEDILFRRILKFLRWLDQPKKTNITRFIGGGLSKRKWTEAIHRKASHIHDSDHPKNITAMASTSCTSSAFATI